MININNKVSKRAKRNQGGYRMKLIGLVVNPIAGMGGRVGLKGTDGKEVLQKARELGSIPEAPIKAKRALKQLLSMKDDIKVLVASGDMGENEVKEVGLNHEVVYTPDEGDTDVNDTYELTKKLEENNVELIIFVGGDGTARDMFNAIGMRIPALGVPAGVKIHSPVYGNTPESAGKLALEYLKGDITELKEEEVMDIEEEAFRRDEIVIELYGYLKVPFNELHLQNLKSPSPQSDSSAQESAALFVIDEMEDDVFYVVGSGTTTAVIMQELGLEHTILGVDIIKNKQLVKRDATEQDILDTVGDEPFKLIITPMGGQGYIFGRGNQQLSANVLRKIDKKDIIIIATPGKMRTIGRNDFIIYTLDDEMDEKLTGYYKVVVGYGQMAAKKGSSPK